MNNVELGPVTAARLPAPAATRPSSKVPWATRSVSACSGSPMLPSTCRATIGVLAGHGRSEMPPHRRCGLLQGQGPRQAVPHASGVAMNPWTTRTVVETTRRSRPQLRRPAPHLVPRSV